MGCTGALPTPAAIAGSLREAVRTMSARLIDDAGISLPLRGPGRDADGIAASPALRRRRLAMLRCIRSFS